MAYEITKKLQKECGNLFNEMLVLAERDNYRHYNLLRIETFLDFPTGFRQSVFSRVPESKMPRFLFMHDDEKRLVAFLEYVERDEFSDTCILHLLVDRNHQRHQLATRLVQYVKQHSKYGQNLFVEIEPDNNAARALFSGLQLNTYNIVNHNGFVEYFNVEDSRLTRLVVL